MIIRLWQNQPLRKSRGRRALRPRVIQLDERLSRAGSLLPQSRFLIGVSSDLIWEWNLSFCSLSRFVTAAGLVTAAECHRMQTTQSHDYRAALLRPGKARQMELEGTHEVVEPPAQTVAGRETDLYWHTAALLSPPPPTKTHLKWLNHRTSFILVFVDCFFFKWTKYSLWLLHSTLYKYTMNASSPGR